MAPGHVAFLTPDGRSTWEVGSVQDRGSDSVMARWEWLKPLDSTQPRAPAKHSTLPAQILMCDQNWELSYISDLGPELSLLYHRSAPASDTRVQLDAMYKIKNTITQVITFMTNCVAGKSFDRTCTYLTISISKVFSVCLLVFIIFIPLKKPSAKELAPKYGIH